MDKLKLTVAGAVWNLRRCRLLARRNRHHVAPIRVLGVLRAHIRADRDDLETVRARVGDHEVDERLGGARSFHAVGRAGVVSADQRGAALRERQFRFVGDSGDLGDI